ncbi:hypothetical protein MRB53_034664 [Persea americana]|uniref:Uncharacterized protein n=1 Tax=Persea americana TaxID=3435 RepID=A0ACC2K2R2_PERAE|nr:hypothetical protein MRB53_034664 [Persea americana]
MTHRISVWKQKKNNENDADRQVAIARSESAEEGRAETSKVLPDLIWTSEVGSTLDQEKKTEDGDKTIFVGWQSLRKQRLQGSRRHRRSEALHLVFFLSKGGSKE